MTESFTPLMRALVVAALLLATATLMLVAVNTARATAALAVGYVHPCGAHGWGKAARLGHVQNVALRACYHAGAKDCVIRTFFCDGRG